MGVNLSGVGRNAPWKDNADRNPSFSGGGQKPGLAVRLAIKFGGHVGFKISDELTHGYPSSIVS
jgi:hypothetical protein